MTNRRDCPACERDSPNENHGWICTRGAGCVEAAANMPVAAIADDMDALAEMRKSRDNFEQALIESACSNVDLANALTQAQADRDRLKAEIATLRVMIDAKNGHLEHIETRCAKAEDAADALRACVVALEAKCTDAEANEMRDAAALFGIGRAFDRLIESRAALGATPETAIAAATPKGAAAE